MLSSERGGQPRGAGEPVQAGSLRPGRGGLWGRLAPLLLLAGCSSFPSSMNPVSWWHDLQGGKIAEERPPPPGADQPYPNLATVPPKPAAPDRAALASIATALVADRANAQHAAAAAPIADPSSPSASPALFGRGTAPPPLPPGTATATMPAADAPPAPAPTPDRPSPIAEAPPAPPARAPVGTVQSTPLAPPGATAQPSTVVAGAAPALPGQPPPPPNLPGAAAASPSSPPSPPAAPPAPTAAPAPAVNPANMVSVAFQSGSDTLPSSADETLKQLASRRGNGVIAVTGYGDASATTPDAQSAALTLGLSRARAIASALTAAGVPAAAVQVDAAAIGRGGTARLVQ